MLLFAVQCKENGRKNFQRSADRGGLGWVLSVINNYNTKGLRTLVLVKG